MSVAKSLRTFLINIPGHSFTQVAHRTTPSTYNPANGYIWFARRDTRTAVTMERSAGPPDMQFFDIEIYHPDPDAVDAMADLIQTYDCYRGAFGQGVVQGLFVSNQSDDYVPQVDMTDTEHLSSSFLSIEVRSYRES